jgi:hypothetical protein
MARRGAARRRATTPPTTCSGTPRPARESRERTRQRRDPGGVCEHPCCIPWPGRLLLEMALLIPVVGDHGFATAQLSVSLRKEQLDDDFRSCSLDTKDW